MFQSNQGGSFPAHQYLIGATSTPGGAYADYFVSGNPKPLTHPTGCEDAPPNNHVPLVDPQGKEDFKGIYPCFEHASVTDLLENAGHTWHYYAPRTDGMWTAPDSIEHIRSSPHFLEHVKAPSAKVLNDISDGKLADVSWVIPANESSDHAGSNDGSGPSWVASIVNAIGNSPYWQDTAILVTWDDWGGWYDHVKPTIESVDENGFRVPLLVISPFAKKAYVSHIKHTFGSLVKFIEANYGLGSLGYQDARSDDLSDCFDFSQAVTQFQPIKAPLDAAYFIERAKMPQGAEEPDDE